MVLVQHRLGIGQVVLDFGLFAPGQAREHFNVVAHHRRLGRHGRHELELLELGLGLLAGVSRHLGGLDLLLNLLDVRALFALTQFFLDGFDLLVKVKVALVFFHLPFDAATDAFVDVEDVHLTLKLGEQVFQTLLDARQVQHGLLVFKLERQVRCDRVGQTTGIVDAGDRCQDLGRDLFVEFDVLVELLHHRTAQGFGFAAGLGQLCRRFHGFDGGHKVGFAVHNALHKGTLLAFDQNFDRAVGQFEHLQDGRDAADIEHVRGIGLIFGGGFLRHQHDAAVARHGRLQRFDALGAAHKQRDHHVGKDHDIAQRQHRQVDRGGRQWGVSGHGVTSGVWHHMDAAPTISTRLCAGSSW